MKEENPIWEENRKMVWDFKLGNYQTAQVLVIDFIRGHFSRAELQGMIFCVIPASTLEKNASGGGLFYLMMSSHGALHSSNARTG